MHVPDARELLGGLFLGQRGGDELLGVVHQVGPLLQHAGTVALRVAVPCGTWRDSRVVRHELAEPCMSAMCTENPSLLRCMEKNV